MIERDKYITEQVVFVDGMTGTGKTMLTPILATFDRMELPRIEHIYEYVCALRFLGRIEEDAAIALLRMYIDIAGYNTMIARESNFRWTDLSGVWRNGVARRYIARLFERDGDAVLNRMKIQRPILPILSHQTLPVMRPLFTALGSRLLVLEMVRHPLYLLEHWYSYIDRHGTDARDFTVWIGKDGRCLPWFAHGWEEQYVSCSKMDRVVRTLAHLTDLSQKTSDESDPATRAKILVIPFERFVHEPWPYLRQIEKQLNTKTTPTTNRVLRKQKVPRRLYTDGPDQEIYRRYSWRPPEAGTTQSSELKTRWNYAAKEASKEGMAILEKICTEYETRYLSERGTFAPEGEQQAVLQRTP